MGASTAATIRRPRSRRDRSASRRRTPSPSADSTSEHAEQREQPNPSAAVPLQDGGDFRRGARLPGPPSDAALFGIIRRISEDSSCVIRSRGFTLIEIMVVVVILAVLGALVVPEDSRERRQGARHARAERHPRDRDRARPVPARQFQISDDRTRIGGAGQEAARSVADQLSRRRLLEGGAEGPLGQPLPLRESRAPDGRDYDIITLRTRRQARRRRLRRGHQQLLARPELARRTRSLAAACAAKASRSSRFWS